MLRSRLVELVDLPAAAVVRAVVRRGPGGHAGEQLALVVERGPGANAVAVAVAEAVERDRDGRQARAAHAPDVAAAGDVPERVEHRLEQLDRLRRQVQRR